MQITLSDKTFGLGDVEGELNTNYKLKIINEKTGRNKSD